MPVVPTGSLSADTLTAAQSQKETRADAKGAQD